MFGSEFTLPWLTHGASRCTLRAAFWDSVPHCAARAKTRIPSLFWLAPFPLLLERAQGHCFFYTHLLSSICLTHLPGPKGRTTLVPGSVTLSPLPALSCPLLPPQLGFSSFLVWPPVRAHYGKTISLGLIYNFLRLNDGAAVC